MPRRRKRRPNWPVRLILGGTLFGALLYVLGPVAWQQLVWLAKSQAADPHDRYLLAEGTLSRAMGAFSFLWFFAFGTTVGSFLNVVVYRMPLGKSIVWKPSFCPYCSVGIKSTDNVPIIGWLRLRGRCRACRLPISSRYPIVELVTGVALLAIAVPECLMGGWNLPNWPFVGEALFDRMHLAFNWPVLAVFAYHATLVCALLCAGLMRWDNQRPPMIYWAFFLVVGAGVPLFWAGVHRVPWQRFSGLEFETTALGHAAIRDLAGLLVALVVALFFESTRARVARGSADSAVVLSSGLVGVFLGWQTAVLVLMVHQVLTLSVMAYQKETRPGVSGLILFATTVLTICGWSLLPWF